MTRHQKSSQRGHSTLERFSNTTREQSRESSEDVQPLQRPVGPLLQLPGAGLQALKEDCPIRLWKDSSSLFWCSTESEPKQLEVKYHAGYVYNGDHSNGTNKDGTSRCHQDRQCYSIKGPTFLVMDTDSHLVPGTENAFFIEICDCDSSIPKRGSRSKVSSKKKRNVAMKASAPSKRIKASEKEGIQPKVGEGDDGDPESELEDFKGSSLEMRHIRLDRLVNEYYYPAMKMLQQKGCKRVAKYWINVCCPGKQAQSPYNGGKAAERAKKHGDPEYDPEHLGKFTRPDWWPATCNDWENQNVVGFCRHREPDHIKKHERITLCVHLLRVNDKFSTKFVIDQMEDSTEGITKNFANDFHPGAAELLKEIYRVRRREMVYERGDVDGDATVSVMMPIERPAARPRVRRKVVKGESSTRYDDLRDARKSFSPPVATMNASTDLAIDRTPPGTPPNIEVATEPSTPSSMECQFSEQPAPQIKNAQQIESNNYQNGLPDASSSFSSFSSIQRSSNHEDIYDAPLMSHNPSQASFRHSSSSFRASTRPSPVTLLPASAIEHSHSHRFDIDPIIHMEDPHSQYFGADSVQMPYEQSVTGQNYPSQVYPQSDIQTQPGQPQQHFINPTEIVASNHLRPKVPMGRLDPNAYPSYSSPGLSGTNASYLPSRTSTFNSSPFNIAAIPFDRDPLATKFGSAKYGNDYELSQPSIYNNNNNTGCANPNQVLTGPITSMEDSTADGHTFVGLTKTRTSFVGQNNTGPFGQQLVLSDAQALEEFQRRESIQSLSFSSGHATPAPMETGGNERVFDGLDGGQCWRRERKYNPFG